MTFLAPRLGTYQAVIAPDAGTHKFTRHITHRAVLGVSMGGGAAALFGLRHHDKFDALGPLGGPVDWTWMLDHIEHNHIAGFQPNDGVNVPAGDGLLPMPGVQYQYQHPSMFNQWWYEYPKNGNGGTFARDDYTQIFHDLVLMYGNPNSQNDDPGSLDLPRGVPATDKSVVGLHSGDQCHVYVDPVDGDPNEPAQQELWQNCPKERCANPLTLHNYFDDEFNPNGTWPVITVCEGGPQDPTHSPWSNQWNPANSVPLSMALAVDYNGNGVRDANEPILRQGHENWHDDGADGKPSSQESGYMKGVNDDPAGDDYQAQYNPNGTEGDARFTMGEAFDDFGLDGVANTPMAGKPFDVGEGDGKFSVATGLQNFWDHDSRSALHQWVTPPGGPLDDDALKRIDIWTDGGTRDLFNFDVAAMNLLGAFSGRGRDAAYYTGWTNLPGQAAGSDFTNDQMRWEDLQGGVMLRYGPVDATKNDLDDGSGQHVGTADEILQRLESAFYFSAQRWPDASRVPVQPSKANPMPGVDQCEVIGSCDFDFTDSNGRSGPVQVSLPPGYANADQQNVTYPVFYVLHGYGQTPQDLGAAVILLSNWMNAANDSSANRMPKAIAVYVDGRCRIGANGKPECVRGSFYADSPDAERGQFETYFLDLMDEIDKKYRTMPPSDIDWTE
jgi:S-formylglutathione hydrolase FrmB